MSYSNFKSLVFLLLTYFITICSVTAQSFLHAEDKDIVDENGEKILLSGVGLGNWMLPEGYMWKFGEHGDRPRRIEKIVLDYLGEEKAEEFWKAFHENYITEADIKRIAELGFNSVRPALNSRLFIMEGDKNEFVDEGFQLLDNLIGWCKKYNLYVIIDMHGAPGGQTGQNIDDSPKNEPELFMDKKNEELLVKLWVKIAERYKNEPTVAAYDLLNEPLPENTGAAEKYKHQLVPLYQKLIKAIREVDQKHMFTIEGYNWSNNWSLFEEPLDDNMFFQFHYYCWNRPEQLNDISYFLEKQNQLNTPVWVGETGEKNNTIYFATTQYFEKNNIGWSFWPWKKMDTKNTPYSIKLPNGWQDIATYSRTGENPIADNPERVFNELLENIKIENCVYFPDVVNSIFRQIPLKIEAENYGHNGYMKSYYVKDTSSYSMYYRKKEPVQVKLINNDKNIGQAVELNTSEWAKWEFNAQDEGKYNVSLQVKTNQQSSGIAIWVNGKSEEIKVSQTDWAEIKLNAYTFKKGHNEVKIEVTQGNISLDWINIYF